MTRKLPAISAARPDPCALMRFSPRTTVLDWLRFAGTIDRNQRRPARKAIAAPGAVVVVRDPRSGRSYERFNSCITLLGQLDGAELITVEDLADDACCIRSRKHSPASTVRNAGFCTPAS